MDRRIPSKITDRHWLVSINVQYEFNKPKEERNSGKWLLFDNKERIDEYWELIKSATLMGDLGPSSKVSTSKISANSADPLVRVICIFTEDFNDLSDIWRIENAIRNLEIKNRLIYKLDKDVGKYAHKGDKVMYPLISECLD